MPSRHALALILATALAGCAHVPELGARPQAKAAASYAAQQSFQAPKADWPGERWWSVYGDAQLDRIVDEALATSPTLAQAQARVRRADAQVEQAGAARRPQVSGNVSAAETKQSYNNGIPALFVPKGYNDTGRATIDLQWDADLYGRNRASLASAVSEAEAQRTDAAQARLMLISNIVLAYADLDRLHGQHDAVDRGIALRKLLVDLASRRVREGVANTGELRQAEAAEAQAQLDLAGLDEQIGLARNRLAALIGAGPDRGLAIAWPAKTADTAFGLPENLALDLVGRRPDLQAARMRADAAASRIKVARAGFYPNINLTAFIGTQALHLQNLVQTGSDIGQVSAALSLPIFSGGRLEGAYRGARADYDLAVSAYDQTLAQALEEVADAAVSERALQVRLVEARKGLAAAVDSARIARLRYEGGLTGSLTAITAEDTAINQQRAVSDLESRRLTLDAQLARALGGGFRAPAS
jgi:NodT family efflux transporter outer membrane factor (OMF) lipoprotein